ncbi:MAG TPA: exodeoxyribonuclease VII large subunit, partial [Pyrinomonadaceae bacterium]|nr:exodeoxyribonuclease VII large subunit [Pyrinomonadaceae bacterium]
APTPSAAAEIVAESEDGIANFLVQRNQDLFQLIDYKLLESRSDLQELSMSPVFTEFPQEIKDWRYQIEDLTEQLRDIFLDTLESKEQRLESLTNRISPLKLASRLNDKKTWLALLRQRQISAVEDVVNVRDERLKIRMASLGALSPLAVLSRGFSITETETGEILRDSEDVKENDNVKIRLARGTIKAKVLR